MTTTKKEVALFSEKNTEDSNTATVNLQNAINNFLQNKPISQSYGTKTLIDIDFKFTSDTDRVWAMLILTYREDQVPV